MRIGNSVLRLKMNRIKKLDNSQTMKNGLRIEGDRGIIPTKINTMRNVLPSESDTLHWDEEIGAWV